MSLLRRIRDLEQSIGPAKKPWKSLLHWRQDYRAHLAVKARVDDAISEHPHDEAEIWTHFGVTQARLDEVAELEPDE